MENQSKNSLDFYQSSKWLKVAKYIRKKNNYCCEICGKRGSIVHHKDFLTEQDYILRPIQKCYGENNLMLVCLDCHNTIHFNKQVRPGCYFDDNGNIQMMEDNKDG